MEESKDTWVIDSGATNHVCVSLQGFRETRSLLDRRFTLRTGDGNLVLAEAVGEVHLYFDEFRIIILRYFFMFQTLRGTLFRLLVYLRVLIMFLLIKGSYLQNKSHICSGWMENNLYFIKPKMYSLLNTEVDNNSKRLKLLSLLKLIFGIYAWVILA